VFYPGATSQPAWIKSLSNRLTGSQATLIVDDIKAGFLRVIKDKEALLGHSCSLAGTSNTGESISGRLSDNNETAAPAPGPSTTLLATTERKQAQPRTKKRYLPKGNTVTPAGHPPLLNQI
jgi:hypothetical protein